MSRSLIALTFAFALSAMVPAGDLAAQQQLQQQQQAQDSITGTITAMAGNSVTLRTDAQQSMTVTVDQLTRILDERGERVVTRADDLLSTLDSGDRVVVNYRTGQGGEHVAVSIEKWTAERHQARGAAAGQDQQRQEQRQTQHSITGTITAMAGNNVTLRTDAQQSMTVRVDQQTRIVDEGGQRVVTRADDLLGNLDSGDRVVVNYRTGDDATDRIAVSIERRATAQLQRRDELPRTNGALPLIALLGLIGLAGAGALSVAVRREH